MKPKFWVPKLWGPSKNGPEEIEFAHRHGHVHPVGALAELAKGEAVEEGAIQTIPATSAMIIIVIATLFLSSSTPEPKP